MNAAFTTNTTGAHSHKTAGTNKVDGGGATDVPYVNGSYNSAYNSGDHSHTITGGGDNETRPINVYVNYIIKY